jgi:hypothetical protein
MPPTPELEDGGRDGGGAPNETTSLLRVGSINSTTAIDDGSIPLTSSYGDLKDSFEAQMNDLTHTTTKKMTMTSTQHQQQGNNLPTKKYVLCIFVFGVALLMGMSVLVLWSVGLIGGGPQNDNGGKKNHDQAAHDHQQNQFVAGDGQPFSLLDPVSDLGLPEVTRSVDASPDWSYLGDTLQMNRPRGDHGDTDDGSSSSNNNGQVGGSTRKNLKGMPENEQQQQNNILPPRQAIPTNSWYENLLLARGPNPSNLQRAYPSPYLVDVVGLIPGLRVHSSHVDANAVGMQLSFNEDFGLVVGASKDKYMPSTTKQDHEDGTSSNEDNDGRTDEPHSHKYKVLEATDIGITLEWVRDTSSLGAAATYLIQYRAFSHNIS